MPNVIAVKWGLHFKELAPELSIVIYCITKKHGFCVCWISISYWEIKWNQINMQCLKDTFAAWIKNFLPHSKFAFFQILWQNQVFGYFHRQTDSCNVLKLNVYHLQTSENFVTANFWLLHSLFVLYMAIDFNIKQACFTVRPMTFGQPHLSPDLGLLSPNFGRFSSTRCWTLFQDAILCNIKEN